MEEAHEVYYTAYPNHPRGSPDENGTRWCIHHIDGDHYNNVLSNLKLMTMAEHYIHHNINKPYFKNFSFTEETFEKIRKDRETIPI